MNKIILNNGIEMPQLGYGCYQVNNEETERCVLDAIEVGYRSIDTAQAYGNELGVGRAIKNSGLAREELFITSKVWINQAGEARAAASIDESLKKLGGDYIDLMLIHQPFGDYYGTYRALEAAQKAGKLRAIGVSNFYPDRLVDLCHHFETVPAVNQVELHPFCQQQAARPWMQKLGVAVQSWGPFAEGRKEMFGNPVLAKIAAAHDRSIAQVILRFMYEQGIILIPKSSHKERMAENFAIFDFELSAEEQAKIVALDDKESAFFSHQEPSTAEFLLGLDLV